MKSFYQTWNRESIDDAVVLKNIKQLSKDQLDMDLELVKEHNLFDSERRERSYDNNRSNSNNRNRNNGGNNPKGGKKKL